MTATDYNIVIKIKYVSVYTVFNHLLYGCTVLHDNYRVVTAIMTVSKLKYGFIVSVLYEKALLRMTRACRRKS